ncbi:type III pantothenate kinase [Thalassomonas actiniarum]|uniref:Type III pantothenate kinase n=1 Tax=Thalassomonas actiniarum TaxID=485447 RepID=A0AAE9YQ48_9GAMM|nr:type III pantothenate kinase [Thalassomonas actiniarum]WDD98776.1 type III pantothenate kinase [Thalassomonas actiniarum]
MMIALVDIGNTRTKYVYQKGQDLSAIEAVANEQVTMMWLDQHFSAISQLIVANVSQNSLSELITSWAERHRVDLHLVRTEKKRFGIVSAYNQPEKLGVDRWLAMIGAYKLYPGKNMLIIDAGTATTVDLLAASGEHLGGWIIPGIDTMFNSILQQTANVAADKGENASIAFGRDTNENVNNACWAATVGAIEVAIRQAETVVSALDLVLMTGGNEKALSNLLESKVTSVKNLVFVGLQAYIAE